MSEELKIPDFENEAAEARWWANHQNQIAAALKQAAKKGRARSRYSGTHGTDAYYYDPAGP